METEHRPYKHPKVDEDLEVPQFPRWNSCGCDGSFLVGWATTLRCEVAVPQCDQVLCGLIQRTGQGADTNPNPNVVARVLDEPAELGWILRASWVVMASWCVRISLPKAGRFPRSLISEISASNLALVRPLLISFCIVSRGHP